MTTTVTPSPTAEEANKARKTLCAPASAYLRIEDAFEADRILQAFITSAFQVQKRNERLEQALDEAHACLWGVLPNAAPAPDIYRRIVGAREIIRQMNVPRQASSIIGGSSNG